MKSQITLPLLLLLSITLTSCSDDLSVPEAVKANSRVAGIWKTESGDLFSSSSSGDLNFLELRNDGTGTMYNQLKPTGILTCTDFLYAVVSDTTFLIESEQAFFDLSVSYHYEIAEGALTISTQNQAKLVLTSQARVSEANLCKTFKKPLVIDNLKPLPTDETDLVSDGTVLWFSGVPTGLAFFFHRYPFNPSTGKIGNFAFFSGDFTFRDVETFQDGDFWLSQGTRASRRNLNLMDVEIDQIDVFGPGINRRVGIAEMAWDGNHLWVHGYNSVIEQREFLQIDSNAEPDELVATFPFDHAIRGLAWDGSDFWAITQNNRYVIRISPETLKATATYFVPQKDISWQGIEAFGKELYLLGVDQTVTPNDTVIARVNP